MPTKDVLIFASNELGKYSTYTIQNSKFFTNLGSEKANIKQYKTDIDAMVLKEKDERNLSFFYHRLINGLERIVTGLTKGVSFEQDNEKISGIAQAPLAKALIESINLIKEKFYAHAVAEQGTELSKEMQVVIKQKSALLKEKEAVAGLQLTLSEEKQTVTQQKSALLEEKKAVAELQLTLSEEKQAVTQQQSALLEEKKAVSEQQLALLEEKKTIANQQLALVEQRLELSKEQQSIAKSFECLAKALNKMPKEQQEILLASMKDVSELNIVTLPNGYVEFAATLGKRAKPPSSETKYSAKAGIMLTEAYLASEPYEGAKLAFAIAMSWRGDSVAKAATFLYRYLLRFRNTLPNAKPSLRHEEYTKENSQNKKDNLQIIEHVLASIFYLFMAIEKNWEQIQKGISENTENEVDYNPLWALTRLAKDNGLKRLASKMERICLLPCDTQDSASKKEKVSLREIAKCTGMFFKNIDLSKRHLDYSRKLYGKKDDNVQHDSSLPSLYRPG